MVEAPLDVDMEQVCAEMVALVAEEVPAYQGARPWELTVRVVGDDVVQGLNKEFRGKDAPTNVLSFENDDDGLEERWYVGDVMLAAPTVVREAHATGRTVESHVRHLLVHGLLHLVGYDHMEPVEAQAMEALETKILARAGVPNPYEDVE